MLDLNTGIISDDAASDIEAKVRSLRRYHLEIMFSH